MSTLTISDLKFDVISANLDVNFAHKEAPPKDHTLAWGVTIRADQKKGPQKSWKPKFTGEDLIETKPKELKSWRDLAGRQGSWAEDHNERGFLYTYEHVPVVDVTWRFELAKSGRLAIVVDGFSDFNHGDGYQGKLPLHLEAELDFVRIPMRKDSKTVAMKRRAEFGLTDPLEFRIEDGVSYLIPTDYPHP